MDSYPTDMSPTRQFPDQTLPRPDISPTDTSPRTDPRRTGPRQDISPNGNFPIFPELQGKPRCHTLCHRRKHCSGRWSFTGENTKNGNHPSGCEATTSCFGCISAYYRRYITPDSQSVWLNNHRFMDGTFATVPEQFVQFYTVHDLHRGRNVVVHMVFYRINASKLI